VTGHLALPAADFCVFCDYLSGARPFTILRRTDLVATLVTREQRGRAHLLVIPTRHAPTILDLTPEEATAVMAGVVDAARAVDAAERQPGIAVWQNNGTPAMQKVPHCHFHVAATHGHNGTEWGEVARLDIADTDRIADRLRPHLPA
jgi:histidine triad (HIT) family protein